MFIQFIASFLGDPQTAGDGCKTLSNSKGHNYVIQYLIKSLEVLKINNYTKSSLKVTSFGDISHLQTLVYSKIHNLCPFDLLKVLHPSPAVCGSPKRKQLIG